MTSYHNLPVIYSCSAVPLTTVWISLTCLYRILENQGIKDSNLIEGDMILNAGQKLAAKLGMDVDAPISRGSITTKHWPGGVLVYDIAPVLSKKTMYTC